MEWRSIIPTIKVFFGYKVCPQCGSSDIIKRGFEDVNLRYDCESCGETTYIYSI